MKRYSKQVIGFFNRLLFLVNDCIKTGNASLYFFGARVGKKNELDLTGTKVARAHVRISGENNKVDLSNSFVENTSIVVAGNNNHLILGENVKLRKAVINIRGYNCIIAIGENTSFGGVRIVNVGSNNDILIGRNCLFADNIEIWASDTHSIYDEEGHFINQERPISIGDNIWAGSYVKILKGVFIGEGAIIGMNSMVTKDVPAASLCAGNPLRVLKSGVSWSLKYERG